MANDAATTGQEPRPTMSPSPIPHDRQDPIDLPVMDGTIGPRVIDIRKLYTEHDVFTFDPGFTSTASCESKITYIDGEKGILLHRGYPIEELAEKSDFIEVCYLLLYGELPNGQQKTEFRQNITHHTMLHEQIHTFYRGFRRDAHPMAVMCGVVGALSAFYHDCTDINDPHQRDDRLAPPDRQDADHRGHGLQIFDRPALHLSAQRPDLRRELPAHDLRRAGEDYKVNPVVAKAMDRIFILHADHEQNASTSTVRLAGSSRRQSLRLHRRRHRLALGPGAWRRQRGGAQHAARDRRQEAHPRIHQAAPRTRTITSA